MPDDDNPQGSWQSDPTGRFKLRWQRASGKWTHHVHDHDGNPQTDPYTPEPEKPRKKRKILRRVFIALGVAMALIVVLAVIGALVEQDADPAATPPSTTTQPAAGAVQESVASATTQAVERSTTTTARRTTTTTTARRTTTTAPAVTDEECGARATAFAILLPEVIDWFDTLALQASIGDLFGMQETYDLLKWAMADLPDLSRELLDDCGHHLTESDRREARDGLRQAESGWREIQAVCRSDLAALGFDC